MTLMPPSPFLDSESSMTEGGNQEAPGVYPALSPPGATDENRFRLDVEMFVAALEPRPPLFLQFEKIS